jgi:purine-binding chemotaxis protein CheW
MTSIVDPTTGDIDWPEFHRRMERLLETSQTLHEPSPDQSRRILAERARRLAMAPDPERQADQTMEIVGFKLGRETYGLETRYAREVIRLVDFTVVPGVPDFMIGVSNLRGDILPVFDLMRFFGLASQGLMERSRVVVVGLASAEFGVIADQVQAVHVLTAPTFVEKPPFEVSRGRECIRGVTADAMIVLDGDILVRDQRLFIGAPGELPGDSRS